MKIRSLVYTAIILLLCLFHMGIYGCNEPAKSTVHQKGNPNAHLKELDKAAFLTMVGSVVQLLGKNENAAQQADSLINAYHSKYFFTISSQKVVKDTGNVFVNISNRQHSLFIMFGLSKNYRQQFSYADLEKKFGKGKVGILPKEPLDIPVTFVIKGPRNNVYVTARCKTFPEDSDNVIYDITVSRM